MATTTHLSIGNDDPAMLLSPPASPVPGGGGGGGGGPSQSRFRASSNSAAAAAAAPRSLALKISRLLSATLEDAGTRSALETLDEFALFDVDRGNPAAAVDPAAAAAPSASASVTGTRSTKSRKLRAEIDKRLLDDSQRFLSAFKEVNEVGIPRRRRMYTYIHTYISDPLQDLAPARRNSLTSSATSRACTAQSTASKTSCPPPTAGQSTSSRRPPRSGRSDSQWQTARL